MPRAQNSTRRAGRRRGFTLVEAVSAVAILAVAMPAMLWAIRESVRKRADPILCSRARWLAAEALEDCIADRNSTTRGYGYVVSANYPAEFPVAGFWGMSRTVSVSETGPNFVPGTGWKTVTATVSYTDGQGSPRNVSLATVVVEYTP